MYTIIGFTLLTIGLIFSIIFIFSLLKSAGEYDDASNELYRIQLKYMMDMQKVEEHKKMLDDVNQNPEYIDKE